jgi:hypothetical protein
MVLALVRVATDHREIIDRKRNEEMYWGDSTLSSINQNILIYRNILPVSCVTIIDPWMHSLML